MTPTTAKAKSDQMLMVEKRKLLRLVQAQVELWDGQITSAGATHVFADVNTIAGRCSITASVHGSGAIFGRFHDPERAIKAGVTMASPSNGKWVVFFDRVTADVAAMQFINALSGFIGEPAEWTLPPPPPPVFTSKPLPVRTEPHVSPFAGTTKEQCSNCLQPFERPRETTSDLCLKCCYEALEDARSEMKGDAERIEELDKEVDEMKKEKRELHTKFTAFADEHRKAGRWRDMDELDVLIKELKS